MAWARARHWLPEGGTLPVEVWARRHRGVLTLLWAHVPAILLFALARQESLPHSITEAGVVAFLAWTATVLRANQRLSTVIAAVGLLTCSAVLVHLSGGMIEMHFHFFVMVGVVTLYQDWWPFLVAIGYVVLQHGVAGALDPGSVYNHHAAIDNPWKWATIHGVFILGMSSAGIASWRLNESLIRSVEDRGRKLAEAQEVARLGSWEWDVVEGAVLWSDELYRLRGLDPAEFTPTYESFLANVHPDDRDRVATGLQAALALGEPYASDYRIVLPDGEVRWLHGRGEVTARSAGTPLLMAGTAQDITERKRAEASLLETLSLLGATFDSTADGILVVDLEGHITSFNRMFAQMWRLPDDLLERGDDDEALGFVLEQVRDPEAFIGKVRELYSQPDAESHDVIQFHDGRIFERYSQPQCVDGQTVGRVWTFRDVTERARLEEELAHQAFHDSLTSLANQALFRDRVEHALARATRSNSPLAVLFLDLDNFKRVNDSLGHTAGDQLLLAVAERLRGCLRSADTAARLGGDEFAVLLEDLDNRTDASEVADRLVEALGQPFTTAGREVFVGASIGIAFDAPGTSSDQLLRNADLAMYRAKAAGKGRSTVFEPGMHAAAVERLEMEADLRRALDRGEFVLQYQPIVALDTGAVSGVEALVRWHHPERGVLAPLTFIPLAEETGLIQELGRQVLVEACTQARRWQTEHPSNPPLMVSVNLSPRQLQDDALVEHVVEALDIAGLAPETLVLEITEGAMMHDTEATIRKLDALKALGVRLAVDDFGTGYSSLSYLQRFPIDILKIDRSFVNAIESGEDTGSLASAIVSMAQTLQLLAVAEGVETAAQAEVLAGLGCDLAQGYYLSRPKDRDEVDEILRASRSAGAAGDTARDTAPVS